MVGSSIPFGASALVEHTFEDGTKKILCEYGFTKEETENCENAISPFFAALPYVGAPIDLSLCVFISQHCGIKVHDPYCNRVRVDIGPSHCGIVEPFCTMNFIKENQNVVYAMIFKFEPLADQEIKDNFEFESDRARKFKWMTKQDLKDLGDKNILCNYPFAFYKYLGEHGPWVQ